jgi:hypothetical protein
VFTFSGKIKSKRSQHSHELLIYKWTSPRSLKVVRESGSHIRLVSTYQQTEHKITIPDHQKTKIGTLHNILNDIADYLKVGKKELIDELFKLDMPH